MTPLRKHAAVPLALLATAASVALLGRAQSQSAPAAPAQTQPAPQTPAQTPSRSVVVLDPAHGGPDAGARLGEQSLEKDVTLALAARLRTVLSIAGFTVVSTRQADSLDPLTTGQRAEIANRTHAIACLVIHATGSGSGVHLYASALAPKESAEPAGDAAADLRPAFEPTPWETAQADSITQSLHLQSDLTAALRTTGIPVVAGRTEVQPLDSLMCPAVAVELAPLAAGGEDATPVTDPEYQQRVADALAQALQQWRSQADAAAAPAMPGGTP